MSIDHLAADGSAPERLLTDPSGLDDGPPLRLVAEPENLVDAAVDVLMVRHQMSRDQASDLLEQAAGSPGRSLSQVARDVVRIGLPSLPTQIELRTPADPGPHPAGPHGGAGTGTTRTPAESVASALLAVLAGTRTVPDLLVTVARLATDVVTGCEAAGVTLVRDGAPATVASPDARVRLVDETQFRHGAGPYLRAAHTGRMVRIDDISAAAAGEAWAEAALEAGFTAALTVPIVTGTDTAATISVYAARPGGWTTEALAAAEVLAQHAADAIAVLERLETAEVAGPA